MCAEELHNSVLSQVGIQSDILPFTEHFLEQLLGQNYIFPDNSDWWQTLRQKCDLNRETVRKLALDTTTPLNYYAVFHHMQQIIPKDAIIVSEGANTMDIGRSMLDNILPKHRLDAGTFGTMGVIIFYYLCIFLNLQINTLCVFFYLIFVDEKFNLFVFLIFNYMTAIRLKRLRKKKEKLYNRSLKKRSFVMLFNK